VARPDILAYALSEPLAQDCSITSVTWTHDNLAPVETLLFRGPLAKVGRFECPAAHPCFRVTEAVDNDVFVLPRNSLWLRRGAGDYRFVEPGAIVIHRAGSMIERRSSNQSGDSAYWFAIHPDVFAETLERHALSARDISDALVVEPKIRCRLAVLANAVGGSRTNRLTAEEEVLSLFFEICEKCSARARNRCVAWTATAARRRRLAERARAYVDAHLAQDFGLEHLAREVGSSLHHLCRTFREQTGLTLHSYRMRQRLGHAVDRIVAGEHCSLTDLALQTGFSSHSHLCRQFRRQLGISPSSLR
jgi:AraC-like DNA-binding protein